MAKATKKTTKKATKKTTKKATKKATKKTTKKTTAKSRTSARSALSSRSAAAPKQQGGRKMIDCREYPSESNCSLAIMGTEDEVLDAAVHHAIRTHGHKARPGLRAEIRGMLKPA